MQDQFVKDPYFKSAKISVNYMYVQFNETFPEYETKVNFMIFSSLS